MMDRVKVALVGISGYGDIYVSALLDSIRNGSVDLVGLVDPAAQRSRRYAELEKAHIPFHPTLESLYTQCKPDLVMIASPIHLHADQICFCLARQSHVLCEKPLATSVRDARRIIETEQRSNRFVGIGFQWSFTRSIQDMKRDIRAGRFGKPTRFKSLVSFPRGFDYYSRNDWAGRKHSRNGTPIFDSPVNNAAAHYIHNMLFLLGDDPCSSAIPATVQAELYRANRIENCDTAILRCRTTSGVEILFYTTHAVRAAVGPVCRFEFEKGVIDYDTANGQGFVATLGDGQQVRYGEPRQERTGGIHQCIQAVRTGEPILCGPKAALSHAICVAASHASMPEVHNFPAPMHKHEAAEKGPMISVSGLHEAMVHSYDNWQLPGETGDYPWAFTGRVIDCSDDTVLNRQPYLGTPAVEVSVVGARKAKQAISAGE